MMPADEDNKALTTEEFEAVIEDERLGIVSPDHLGDSAEKDVYVTVLERGSE
jgi:hypothetical protein